MDPRQRLRRCFLTSMPNERKSTRTMDSIARSCTTSAKQPTTQPILSQQDNIPDLLHDGDVLPSQYSTRTEVPIRATRFFQTRHKNESGHRSIPSGTTERSQQRRRSLPHVTTDACESLPIMEEAPLGSNRTLAANLTQEKPTLRSFDCLTDLQYEDYIKSTYEDPDKDATLLQKDKCVESTFPGKENPTRHVTTVVEAMHRQQLKRRCSLPHIIPDQRHCLPIKVDSPTCSFKTLAATPSSTNPFLPLEGLTDLQYEAFIRSTYEDPDTASSDKRPSPASEENIRSLVKQSLSASQLITSQSDHCPSSKVKSIAKQYSFREVLVSHKRPAFIATRKFQSQRALVAAETKDQRGSGRSDEKMQTFAKLLTTEEEVPNRGCRRRRSINVLATLRPSRCDTDKDEKSRTLPLLSTDEDVPSEKCRRRRSMNVLTAPLSSICTSDEKESLSLSLPSSDDEVPSGTARRRRSINVLATFRPSRYEENNSTLSRTFSSTIDEVPRARTKRRRSINVLATQNTSRDYSGDNISACSIARSSSIDIVPSGSWETNEHAETLTPNDSASSEEGRETGKLIVILQASLVTSTGNCLRQCKHLATRAIHSNAGLKTWTTCLDILVYLVSKILFLFELAVTSAIDLVSSTSLWLIDQKLFHQIMIFFFDRPNCQKEELARKQDDFRQVDAKTAVIARQALAKSKKSIWQKMRSTADKG